MDLKSWEAFFVNTDIRPFPLLPRLLESYGDPRLQHIGLPVAMDRSYDDRFSAFHIIDWVIKDSCNSASHHWFLVTNADNWFTPDALNYLPSGVDMVFMNFHGRFTPINELRYSNGTDTDNCCVRFTQRPCFYSTPRIGFVDLGAVLFDLAKFRRQRREFKQFDDTCGEYSCYDGALVQALVDEDGWTYANHPLRACAFHHNANPESCALLGKVYFDTLDYKKVGCYDLTNLPIPEHEINWEAWTKSGIACVCQQYKRYAMQFTKPYF